jgi:hypothetical protein
MARPPKDDDAFVAAVIAKLARDVPLAKCLSWQSKVDRDRIRRKVQRRKSVETPDPRFTIPANHQRLEP